MVAITVILAAVIGAFVLEIGDQQETAPSSSYDSEQRLSFYSDSNNDASNLTTVTITHAGGTVNDVSQTNVKVSGNGSQWGAVENAGGDDTAVPQPDLTATLGSNEKVVFSSGESWEIIGGNNDSTTSDANLDATETYEFQYTAAYEGALFRVGGNDAGEIATLQNGDTVNVIWTASSGGKTQNLFRYTVQ